MSKPHENLLSLFLSSSPKSPKCPSEPKKSPLNFDSRVVGLGIVAAMNDTRDAKPPVSPKSEPIPIVSGRSDTKCRLPVSEMELSESYTCVISRIGCEPEQRREYFGDGMGCNYWEKSGVFWECSPAAAEAVQVVEFLSRCYLCRKKLNGLDVFMYRGDKGFCSAECRCQQMLNDEQREKCGPEALKRFHCSVSSCSGPRLFSAGVVAA
ncbi:hypothetical protein MRB53_022157 [Persea americana]|uniref:Uncharacterized protein n=1 Tax=Persea americana TaxID=3435 RepID=A0ACC2L5Y8_PERAE|nr:hypothetical protein MRB53_022157 [Persea americana]|eukprot:TRINITY_DN2582_c4_g1_i1.p1 TRINITY_DN2582_c4_g1~~TRINITY_DN2582_c4_g1_i1.p1  ORF type:complete len:209 (+),score=26.31 TRINITY_DN2582_c4_g1_i1:322-948(+)